MTDPPADGGFGDLAMKALGSRALGPGARARIAGAWAQGGPRTRAALALAGVLAAALLGACLFGLWHVLFGGFVKGNWRAGGFGVVLVAIAGGLLLIEVAMARRLLPPAAHP